MVEAANTQGPKKWTPGGEQDPGQKALRAKVDDAIIRNTSDKVSPFFGLREESRDAANALSQETVRTDDMVRALGENVVRKLLQFAQAHGERWKEKLDPAFTGELISDLTSGVLPIEDQLRRQDIARRRVSKLVPSQEYHEKQRWEMRWDTRTPEELAKRRQERQDEGFRIGLGRPKVVKVGKETPVSPKREAVPVRPVHGGFGDGAVHVIQGMPLGQKNKDDPTFVRQDALDISNRDVRYHFAPLTEFFNHATGAVERKPEYETITHVTPKGILVLEPDGGWVSEVMTPDAFARETAKTNGILSRAMIQRHTLREGNPLVTAMVKYALRAAITMLSAATPGPDGTAGILEDRRRSLEEKLNALQ